MKPLKERIEETIYQNLPVNYDGTNLDESTEIIDKLTQVILTEIKDNLPAEKELPVNSSICSKCGRIRCSNDMAWNAYHDEVEKLLETKKLE